MPLDQYKNAQLRPDGVTEVDVFVPEYIEISSSGADGSPLVGLGFDSHPNLVFAIPADQAIGIATDIIKVAQQVLDGTESGA